MTLAEIRPPVQTAPPSNTWVNATWEEFVAIADDLTSEKKTCYYYDRQMRIETMGVGPDRAVAHGILTVAIGLFGMLKGIKVRGLTNASYRKPGCQEAQPDASYYVNEKALLVPRGNTIVDLNIYTSLNSDESRLVASPIIVIRRKTASCFSSFAANSS